MSTIQQAFSLTTLGLWFGVGAVALPGSLYLQSLLTAAALRRRRFRPVTEVPTRGARLVVLIPAHNEELVLGATLASLAAQQYPKGRYEVIVIADNCTDTTTRVATDAGVTVWERTDTERRGKGYALEWAIQKLQARDGEACDAVLVVDADTEVAPDFLRVMASRLFSGTPASQWPELRRVLQGRYGVMNVGDSWRSALMAAAFDLVNHVKPLGRDQLGLSVGLKGNGMAFTTGVLNAAPWSGSSITEDIDYGLDLLQNHGVVVGYAPDAVVRAQMPINGKQAASQRERWERGRYQLLRERAPKLFRAGLLRGDLRLIDAAYDLCVPPLAELVALHLLWLGLTALLFNMGVLIRPWLALPALSLVSLGLYVLGGLRVSDAPKAAYQALLRAPIYTVWKLALYLTVKLRGGSAKKSGGGMEWVRTERTPVGAASPETLEDAA